MLKPMDRWAEPPIMEGPKTDGASGTSPSPGLSVGLLCRNGYVQRFRIVWISISEIHNLAHLEFLPIQQIEDQSLIFTEASR